MENSKAPSDVKLYHRAFWLVALLSILVKFFLAWKVPITGDEAYYIMWGKYPALGYYDQPPMIGWVLAAVQLFGRSPVLLRMPAILLSVIIAPFLVDLLKRRVEASTAYLAGILFLIAPIHFLIMILSTDTPLVAFSFFCFYFFYRAIRENRVGFAATAGAFLGLAFLSKYFSVLLALGFGVYVIYAGVQNGRSRFLNLLKMLVTCCVCSIPFVLLHIYWNSTHCWINILFNTQGRNIGQYLNYENTKQFLGYQLYLIGPVLLVYFLRNFRRLWRIATNPEDQDTLFFICWAVPILCFGVASVHYSQGLHWTLSFYPYLYAIAAVVATNPHQLLKVVRWSAVYTTVHTVLVFAVILAPVDRWKDYTFYRGLRMYLRAPELAKVLDTYSDRYELAADGYTEAALFETFSPHRVHVFGEGVLFGRQDDLLTNYFKMNGKDVLVFTRHHKGVSEFAPFFQKVEVQEIVKDDIVYTLFLGSGFRYDVYRDQVLARIQAQYYGHCDVSATFEAPAISP